MLTANKTFVATKLFVAKNIFVATKLLSRLAYFCATKDVFVVTKVSLLRQNFCRDKSFVATKICLLRQKFCRDKHTFVAIKDVFCRDKHVSRQKWYLWQLPPMIESSEFMLCTFLEWPEFIINVNPPPPWNWSFRFLWLSEWLWLRFIFAPCLHRTALSPHSAVSQTCPATNPRFQIRPELRSLTNVLRRFPVVGLTLYIFYIHFQLKAGTFVVVFQCTSINVKRLLLFFNVPALMSNVCCCFSMYQH